MLFESFSSSAIILTSDESELMILLLTVIKSPFEFQTFKGMTFASEPPMKDVSIASHMSVTAILFFSWA